MRFAAAFALLALGACAGPQVTYVPNQYHDGTPGQQALAQCQFETDKAIAPMQNIGMMVHTIKTVRRSCMAAKGFDEVPAT